MMDCEHQGEIGEPEGGNTVARIWSGAWVQGDALGGFANDGVE